MGTIGIFTIGDTLGEESILKSDRHIVKDESGIPLRQENAEAIENCRVFEIISEKWFTIIQKMKELKLHMDVFTLNNMLKTNFQKKRMG